MRCLGLSQDDKTTKSPEQLIYTQIKERQNEDYLPSMQIDGTIEFKPQGILSDVIPSSPKKTTSVLMKKELTPPKQEESKHLQMRF